MRAEQVVTWDGPSAVPLREVPAQARQPDEVGFAARAGLPTNHLTAQFALMVPCP
jgi:hypothetical protein